MYCTRCGRKVGEGTKFCYACGAEIIIPVEDDEPVDDVPQEVEEQEPYEEEQEPYEEDVYDDDDVYDETERKTSSKKKKKWGSKIAGALIIIALASVLVAYMYFITTKCKADGCNNKRATDSEYCVYHLCQHQGCLKPRLTYGNYCTGHTCWKMNCPNEHVEGGYYCIEHTCKVDGCLNEAKWDGNYCFDHRNIDRVDMREYLKDVSLRFKLNSAGGIVFTFMAKNYSPKEIKYVKFKAYLYNAVKDSVNDDIKDLPYIDVSITGPVKRYKWVSMREEIIGYCDECTRIDIGDVTIEYMDGSSDTGRLGYYTEH